MAVIGFIAIPGFFKGVQGRGILPCWKFFGPPPPTLGFSEFSFENFQLKNLSQARHHSAASLQLTIEKKDENELPKSQHLPT